MIRRFVNKLKHQTIRKLMIIDWNIIRIPLKTILHPKTFHASLIQNIHPSTEIACEGGVMQLSHSIFTRRNVSFRSNEGGKLEIGTAFFNQGCTIMCMKHVKIGDDCIFGSNVVICDDDHDYRCPGNKRGANFKTSEIIIGNNVWIGANVVILRDSIIGDNCVIAAGCIIKGQYDEDSLVIQKCSNEIVKKIDYYNN